MKKLILSMGNLNELSFGYALIGKYLSVVFLVALMGNIIISHQASATFFAAKGETKIISGTDRVQKDSKGNYITATKANPVNTLYVYPQDTVGWKASVWNGGDLGHTTTVYVGNDYPDGSSSDGSAQKPYALTVPGVQYYDRPLEEFAITFGAALVPYYGYGQSDRDWFPANVAMNSVNMVNPGDTFCQYDGVTVAGFNIIPWPGAYPSIPGIEYGPVNFRGGNEACAVVAYNYHLQPGITLNHASANSDTVGPSVTQDPTWLAGQDSKNVTYSDKTQWQVTQIIIKPGASVPNKAGGTSTTQVPCNNNSTAYFKPTSGANTPVTCSTVEKSNGKDTVFNADGSFKSGSSPSATTSFSVPAGLPVGTIVCYSFSVNSYTPYSAGTNNWSNSAPVCWTNTPPSTPQKPTLQVHGGDVRVGRCFTDYDDCSTLLPNKEGIYTSQFTLTGAAAPNGLVFGSWVEYGELAPGPIVSMASLSGYAGGYQNQTTIAKGCPTDSVGAPNKLTFANNGTAECGDLSRDSMGQIPDDVNSLKSRTAINNKITGTLTLTSLAPGLYENLNDTAGLTITASTIASESGSTYIIYAPKETIDIAGSIVIDGYSTDGSYKSISQIPQVIIIAKHININGSDPSNPSVPAVSEVDAWLIADDSTGTDGVINTCTTFSVSGCNAQLTVNGPIMARQLQPWRTYSTEKNCTVDTQNDITSPTGCAKSGDSPAETFNLPGSSLLWALNQGNPGVIQTTNVTELPPYY